MENKINIAKLLKDCQKGMELDCTKYSNVYFIGIDDCKKEPKIKLKIETSGTWCSELTLDKYGKESSHPNAKCLIFPKGKTTWEGFHRPFKDGDIVTNDNTHRDNFQIFIFKKKIENNTLSCCYLMLDGDELDLEEGMYYITRLATEEEKQKLFDAIKANGYKWDEKTKTLEKLIEPKFKVGDKIKFKGDNETIISIIDIKNKCYFIQYFNSKKCDYQNEKISFKDQDHYELVPNRFDIFTLKSFDKVLVRNSDKYCWTTQLFSFYKPDSYDPFKCLGQYNGGYPQCIPYEGNEYLLGTTDDCSEFYKIWEK